MDEKINEIRQLIDNAPKNSIVFFGGAGVSTESGIPDFRSADGLYSLKYPYPPETMLSHSFFDAHPGEFFDFYFDRVATTDAKPNRAHLKLTELERDEKLSAVVTQNIDGLHQAAGSKQVYELHGSILRNFCTGCGKAYNVGEMTQLHEESLENGGDGVPRCQECGAVIKPDVVLYEEPLDQQVMMNAIKAIANANLMIVAGTSLVVNPAASMLQYFRGNNLAIVNKSTTPYDNAADIVISASIGDVLDF